MRKIMILGTGAQGSTIAKRMQEEPGIEEIVCADYDMRAADCAAGGQGAPLVPIYHHALVAKLPSASLVWMGDVTISAVMGFAAAYYILHLPIAPALTIGAALSATSVGVSTAVWEDAHAPGSSNGPAKTVTRVEEAPCTRPRTTP